jgi:predicted PurR-regulated permease PerM
MSKTSSSAINQKVIVTAAILSVIALFLFLRNYFMLIAVSAILAYLFNPVYTWFLNKFKRGAVTLTVITLFATIAIPLAVLLTITIEEAAKLADQVSQVVSTSGSAGEAINTLVADFNEQADKLPFVDGDVLNIDQITEWLKNSLSTIASTTLNFLKSFAGGIANFFTTLIIFLFIFSSLLKNQKKILSWLEDMNPLGTKMNDVYLQKMGAMTTAMVKGQFIIAIMQGLSGTLSLWIAGMDYLAFWFVLLTFLSIIPLGGGIILIPFGIILILTGNIWQGVLILAWHFIITTNIDNIFRPKFVPKSARLDPALTILSVFAGISIFGFLGIVLGPVVMIVLLTTLDMYLTYTKKMAEK